MLTQLTQRVPVLVKSITARKMDALELLTRDHLKIESIFLQLRFLNQISTHLKQKKVDLLKRREMLFDQLQHEIKDHTSIEEHIFYPECEKSEELKSIIQDLFEEHKQIKTLLDDMKELSIENENFQAKLNLLIEDVSTHVSNEEEDLFPRVRRIFSRSRLERLATQIRNKKQARHAA